MTIRVSTQSIGFGFLSALLFLSSPTMIEIYSFAMSEGLYLCLTLLGFLLFNEALKKNLRVALLTAVLVLGSAGLTRSAAVANIAAALIVYVLWREKPTLRKLGEAALFGFLCLLPALWWAGYIYRLTMTFNDRQPGFYPLVLKNYLTAVRTIFTWVLPEHFVTGYEGSFGIFLLALSLGTSLFYLWFWFQKTRTLSGAILSFRRFPLVALLFGSFSLFYLAVIFAAKTFFDPAIGMSARILSPLLLSLIVLGVQFLHSLWKRGFLPLRGFSLVVAAYLLFFNLYFARYTVAEFHDKGLGLGRAEVQNSETMQSLPELARSYPVFSNDPFSLYFFTDQVGYRLNGFSPEKVPTGVAVLAIFGTGEDHPVYRKYSDYLELLAKDSIASLYIYRSSAGESNTGGTNGDLTTTRDLRWVHTLARFNRRLYN